jgi:hypothetical protein
VMGASIPRCGALKRSFAGAEIASGFGTFLPPSQPDSRTDIVRSRKVKVCFFNAQAQRGRQVFYNFSFFLCLFASWRLCIKKTLLIILEFSIY